MQSLDPKFAHPLLTVQQIARSTTSARRKRSEAFVTGLSVWHACLRMILGASLLIGVSSLSTDRALAAPRDRTAPSAPTDLRMTSLGAYQVSLAWGPSQDASGIGSYRLNVEGREIVLSPGATSVRLTWGLSPTASYTFSVAAVDAAGNRSQASNSLRVTLLADMTPPTTPVLALAYAGADKIGVTWTQARDDGPRVTYEVSIDGSIVLPSATATSATLGNLAPDTSYSVQVRALDGAGNRSEPSAPLTVSTGSSLGDDTTAPSTPGRFAVFDDYCGDVFLIWDEALDDRDVSSAVTYDVYVNGRLQQSISGRTWAAFNLTEVGLTRFEVVAKDSSGNASAPAAAALELEGCAP